MNHGTLDGSKLMYHGDRIQEFLRDGRLRAPIEIDMALTQACNYSCVYCYARLQRNEPHRMTWDILRHLAKDAARAGVRSIALQGDGESTLHPDFPAFVDLVSSLKMDIGLATNGYALTEAMIEETIPKLNWIQFNMSAGDPEEYARVMGVTPRHFHVACRNIRQVVGLVHQRRKDASNLRQDAPGTTPTVLTQMVLRPQDAHRVLPYVKQARALGVDIARIKHCSDNPGVDGGLKIAYEKYAKPALQGVLKEAEGLTTDKFKVAIKWSKMFDGDRRAYDRCVGCQFLLQISGSGLVAPCGMLFADQYKEWHLGRLTETRLADILESPKYKAVMARLDSAHFDPAKTCGSLCVQHDANKYVYALRHPPANWRFV
jgi:organic radical activating enzyme